MTRSAQLAYEKKVREWRKMKGYCTRCGHNKSRPGKTMCMPCSIAESERVLRYYYRKKCERNLQND